MITLVLHLLRLLPFLCGGHRRLAIENLALRQQLAVYKRTAPRPRLCTTDRLFWVGLARVWTGWRQALVIVVTCSGTPTADQLSGPKAAGSSRFAKSVACTIATSAGRPDPAQSIRHRRRRPSASFELHLVPWWVLMVQGGWLPLPPIRCPRARLFFGLSGELGRSPTERDQVLAKDSQMVPSPFLTARS